MDEIFTMAQLKAEDMMQDYYDGIAEELKMAEEEELENNG
tara:strand:- start:165 stop:284 length:120 start_codon:yes stop_codon:yes gene_type:complete